MAARRLKILFLTRSYPTASAPVVAPFTRDHALAVARHVDLAVLHSDSVRSTPRGAWAWQVERVTDPAVHQGIPTIHVRYRRLRLRPLSQALFLWSTLRAVREIGEGPLRPDLVHGHFYDSAVVAALAARMLGVPFVLTEHSSLLATRSVPFVERIAARAAFRRARVVMPVSQMLRSALESYGFSARYAVIPNVVDLTCFHPAPPSAPPSPSPPLPAPAAPAAAAKRLIAVTRMTGIKGIDTLLAAAAQLRRRRADWHLELVGGGERAAEFRQLATDLGLGDCTTFHGELQRQEVAARLRCATLFVLPSRIETFSVATVEALACGLPVVVTACGGPEEFVTRDVGTVVPPGDPGALCQAVDEMLDRAGCLDPAAIAATVAGRFSAATVGSQILAVYERALAAEREA